MKISAVVITKNEEKNIENCLRSILWADEIIVVDSFSTDQTVKLAKKITPHVFQIPFMDFATQKNTALNYARHEWILLMDADERISVALAKEIQQIVATSAGLDTVYSIHRNTFFFGKRLRFSGTSQDFQIRLFPKGKAVYIQPVHEVLKTPLPIKKLKESMDHLSTPHFQAYQEKLRQYVELELLWMKKQHRPVFFLDFLLRPPLKFIHLYILQGGLLDGIAGLQYAFLSSVYVFLKYFRYFKASV